MLDSFAFAAPKAGKELQAFYLSTSLRLSDLRPLHSAPKTAWTHSLVLSFGERYSVELYAFPANRHRKPP